MCVCVCVCVGKCCRNRNTTDENVKRCMRITCCVTKTKDRDSEYLDFSMAQEIAARQSLLTIALRHITLGRNPTDELSARRSDNTHYHKRQTSMTPVGFEPTIPASERPYTPAFERETTGLGQDK